MLAAASRRPPDQNVVPGEDPVSGEKTSASAPGHPAGAPPRVLPVSGFAAAGQVRRRPAGQRAVWGVDQNPARAQATHRVKVPKNSTDQTMINTRHPEVRRGRGRDRKFKYKRVVL